MHKSRISSSRIKLWRASFLLISGLMIFCTSSISFCMNKQKEKSKKMSKCLVETIMQQLNPENQKYYPIDSNGEQTQKNPSIIHQATEFNGLVEIDYIEIYNPNEDNSQNPENKTFNSSNNLFKEIMRELHFAEFSNKY